MTRLEAAGTGEDLALICSDNRCNRESIDTGLSDCSSPDCSWIVISMSGKLIVTGAWRDGAGAGEDWGSDSDGVPGSMGIMAFGETGLLDRERGCCRVTVVLHTISTTSQIPSACGRVHEAACEWRRSLLARVRRGPTSKPPRPVCAHARKLDGLSGDVFMGWRRLKLRKSLR